MNHLIKKLLSANYQLIIYIKDPMNSQCPSLALVVIVNISSLLNTHLLKKPLFLKLIQELNINTVNTEKMDMDLKMVMDKKMVMDQKMVMEVKIRVKIKEKIKVKIDIQKMNMKDQKIEIKEKNKEKILEKIMRVMKIEVKIKVKIKVKIEVKIEEKMDTMIILIHILIMMVEFLKIPFLN